MVGRAARSSKRWFDELEMTAPRTSARGWRGQMPGPVDRRRRPGDETSALDHFTDNPNRDSGRRRPRVRLYLAVRRKIASAVVASDLIRSAIMSARISSTVA